MLSPAVAAEPFTLQHFGVRRFLHQRLAFSSRPLLGAAHDALNLGRGQRWLEIVKSVCSPSELGAAHAPGDLDAEAASELGIAALARAQLLAAAVVLRGCRRLEPLAEFLKLRLGAIGAAVRDAIAGHAEEAALAVDLNGLAGEDRLLARTRRHLTAHNAVQTMARRRHLGVRVKGIDDLLGRAPERAVPLEAQVEVDAGIGVLPREDEADAVAAPVPRGRQRLVVAAPGRGVVGLRQGPCAGVDRHLGGLAPTLLSPPAEPLATRL